MKAAKTVFDLEDRLIRFAVLAFRIAESLPATRIGKHVAGQLISCGTVAPPNYAGAQTGKSRKDFVHKMRLCLKELRETLAWFKLANRLGIGDAGMLKEGIMESDELVRIFVTSIATAKRNDSTRS